MLVPGAGIEPALPCGKRILSPLRLPVSPPGHGDKSNVTRTPLAIRDILPALHAPAVQTADLPRKLRLRDAVGIVSGTIIGSGIFLVPNLVARNLSSPPAAIALWIFAGILSLFGALAYAELGAMIPATGGPYVYLREAYGPMVAFLCGWTFFTVALSASVAWLGIAFSNYLGYLIPLSPWEAKAVALALIVIVAAFNYRRVTAGAAFQNICAVLKISGLAVLIAGAFFLAHRAAPAAPYSVPLTFSRFNIAFMACLLSYDGWGALSFVAGEVREPHRNLTRAAAIGLAIVMSVYVLANLAYMRVLPLAEIAATDRVGALAAERIIGSAGGVLVTITVLFSIAGSMNGWVMTAPRIYFAQARDGLFFRRMGEVHPRFGTPAFSIAIFCAWSAVLVLSGTYESLASYAMFASWISYGLTAAGVIILRRREPGRARPYRMPGYPITLILFIAVAATFVIGTCIATPGPALAGGGLIATGIPVYYLWSRTRKS